MGLNVQNPLRGEGIAKNIKGDPSLARDPTPQEQKTSRQAQRVLQDPCCQNQKSSLGVTYLSNTNHQNALHRPNESTAADFETLTNQAKQKAPPSASIQSQEITHQTTSSESLSKKEQEASTASRLYEQRRMEDCSSIRNRLVNNELRIGDAVAIAGLKGEVTAIEQSGGIAKAVVRTTEGQHYLIKNYAPGSYNGPDLQDFLDLQNLMYQGACLHLDSLAKGASPELQLQLAEAKEQIAHMKAHLDDKLRASGFEDVELDLKKAYQEGTPAAQDKATNAYKNANKNFIAMQAQFARDIQHCINTIVKDISHFMELGDLELSEKLYIASHQRPAFVNFYQAEGKTFVNMQRPLSVEYHNGKIIPKNTLPSSLRDRPGVPNYVKTTFGEVKKDGQVSLLIDACRHSSLPPIAVKNKLERRALTLEKAKEIISNRAVELYGLSGVEQSTETHPVSVSMHSMMLLTPVLFDDLRNQNLSGDWKGEGETLQLKEILLAMRTLDGRTIKMEIDGKPAWVKVRWTGMNIGANAPSSKRSVKPEKRQGVFAKLKTFFSRLFLHDAPVQQEFNAQGSFDFFSDMEEHLKSSGLSITSPFAGDSKLGQLQQQLEQQKAKFLPVIREKYAAFENALTHRKYDDYHQIKEEIHKLESQLDDTYEKIETRKKELFSKSKDIRLKLEKAVGEAKAQVLMSKQGGEKESLLKLLGLYQQATQLYFSNEYRDTNKILEFQAAYILAYQQMNAFVNFGCKSAEDRTGALDNKMQELSIYLSNEARQGTPLTDDGRAWINRYLAPTVWQYSASGDNTKANSEARGLQIGKDVTTRTVLPEVQKLGATLAKKRYKAAKKVVAPSNEAEEQLRNYHLEAARRRSELQKPQPLIDFSTAHTHPLDKQRSEAQKLLNELQNDLSHLSQDLQFGLQDRIDATRESLKEINESKQMEEIWPEIAFISNELVVFAHEEAKDDARIVGLLDNLIPELSEANRINGKIRVAESHETPLFRAVEAGFGTESRKGTSEKSRKAIADILQLAEQASKRPTAQGRLLELLKLLKESSWAQTVIVKQGFSKRLETLLSEIQEPSSLKSYSEFTEKLFVPSMAHSQHHFLLTYRWFMKDLARKATEEGNSPFSAEAMRSLSDKKKNSGSILLFEMLNDVYERGSISQKQQVLKFVHEWLGDIRIHNGDHSDPEMKSRIDALVSNAANDHFSGLSPLAKDLQRQLDEIDSKQSAPVSIKGGHLAFDGVLQQVKTNIKAIGTQTVVPQSPEEYRALVRTCTKDLKTVSANIFKGIRSSEFTNLNWKDPITSPGITAFTSHFDQLAAFVQKTILDCETVEERSRVTAFFIDIAKNSLDGDAATPEFPIDVNTANAIYAALTTASIFRLKETFEGLSNETKKKKEELEQFFSRNNNFGNERAFLKDNENKPLIPYLGLLQSNLTAFREKSDQRKLLEGIGGVLEQIEKMQNLINPKQEVATSISDSIAAQGELTHHQLLEVMLPDPSLRKSINPKGSDDVFYAVSLQREKSASTSS